MARRVRGLGLFIGWLAVSAVLIGAVAQAAATPTFLFKFGIFGAGGFSAPDGQFYWPVRVAVDASGNIYVADYNNDRIQKFDPSGSFLGKIAVSRAYGVAVDADGNIYGAEFSSSLIKKFDPGGTFLSSFGSYGSGDGQFIYPRDVDVDADGNIYVVDNGNARIQKFDPTGHFLLKFGSYGSGDGQLAAPYGVAVDSSGNIYVADAGNSRIQKFDPSGNFLLKFGSSGSGNGQFSSPLGIAVDAADNVLVADTGNGRVQEFDSSGNFLLTFSSPYGFPFPIGIAAGGSGHIYVSEMFAERVQVFHQTPSDTTPPVISPQISGSSGNNGWFVSDVTVSWTVTDPDSAITSTAGCAAATVTTNTAGTTFTCTATSAGGTDSRSVTVGRDATPPAINGIRSPGPNAAGWNHTDVVVSFTCSDDTSGIATCPGSTTVIAEGANQIVSATAFDNAGNEASATVSGISIDKNGPVITVPGALAAEATSAAGSVVTYSASASDDLSGTGAPTCSPASGSTFALGTTAVTCTATDLADNSASKGFTVNVVDTTPPAIAGLSVSSAALWPPNHKMVDITVNYTATDAVSAVTSSLTAISSEPDNGLGDGDTPSDFEVVDAHHVRLRAERSGTGGGRIYTIKVASTDGAGNTSTATVTVRVPKNQAK